MCVDVQIGVCIEMHALWGWGHDGAGILMGGRMWVAAFTGAISWIAMPVVTATGTRRDNASPTDGTEYLRATDDGRRGSSGDGRRGGTDEGRQGSIDDG